MAIPEKPITRKQTFLAGAAGQQVTLPEPITREEMYLKAIAEGGGGGSSYSLTVTAVTQDGVTVAGQTVTVRAFNESGAVFATAAYDGQPVSFAVPNGFAYYVSISNTLADHFAPTTASGVINGTDASVSLTYSDFSTINRFTDVQTALNDDVDLSALIGKRVYLMKDDEPLYFNVVDYDNSVAKPVVTLLAENCVMQDLFEPRQALAWFENGLAAGDYSFKFGNTTYYFKIWTAIPAGGQIVANTGAFSTYVNQQATAILENGSISTTEIPGATSLGTTGTGSLNHFNRSTSASDNYAESAIFQWLNSDDVANTPVPRITKFSRAYSYSKDGFLRGIASEDLECVQNADWKCSANNVYECPAELGGITTVGVPYTVKAKFGLASEKEITGSYSGVNAGDAVFKLFDGASTSDRIKSFDGSPSLWYLRSPNSADPNLGRTTLQNGNVGVLGANNKGGFAPVCKIAKNN